MNQLFDIFLLEDNAALEYASTLTEPHIHEYEELLIGTSGELEHFIDFKTHIYTSPYISFVTKGKLHRAKPILVNEKCSIWVILFKSEFIPETTFQLYSYYHDHANFEIKDIDSAKRIGILSQMMHEEYRQQSPDFAVIRQLLGTLFTMIESERKKTEPEESGTPKSQNITFKNFLKIVEENYRRPEGVEFYANKLFMTARNLNLICQQILQQSVSEIIETRKLIEAKNLLLNTEKSIAEIGFELGYNEKAYFTNVFKKKSGQTPSDFRKEMAKLIS
jgi:AraC family transcriptional regulator, transcriptional activator of pobA